jgi:hypothetical protein
MTEDMRNDLEDPFEIEPAELADVFVRAMEMSLAKRLANARNTPWSNDNESELHERIAELVAGAETRGLTTITMTVLKVDGRRFVRDLDVALIKRERTLQ